MTLQQMIRERGLKQGWIAEQIGVQAPQFTLILQGKRPFPEEKVRPLARLLRVTVIEVQRALNGGAH